MLSFGQSTETDDNRQNLWNLLNCHKFSERLVDNFGQKSMVGRFGQNLLWLCNVPGECTSIIAGCIELNSKCIAAAAAAAAPVSVYMPVCLFMPVLIVLLILRKSNGSDLQHWRLNSNTNGWFFLGEYDWLITGSIQTDQTLPLSFSNPDRCWECATH